MVTVTLHRNREPNSDGREGFIWLTCPEPQFTEESQSRSLKAGADEEAVEGCCLHDLLSCFLTEPRTIRPRCLHPIY